MYNIVRNICKNIQAKDSISICKILTCQCVFFLVFSSPEPMAQVSFSSQTLSLSVFVVVFVIFSHFYLLLQNHRATSTKLGTNHLWRKCFKFVPVKDQALFKGEIITIYWNLLLYFKILSKTIWPENRLLVWKHF